MSKKILFMSSAKLTAISIGLLLAVFCTIGMSFRPAEEGDNVGNPNDTTYVSGPRRSHWAESDGCGGSTNKDNKDYARTQAITKGHGTVSITNTTKKGSLTTATTKTSTSAAGNAATIDWDCSGSTDGHTNSFQLTATPDADYYFAGWSLSSGSFDGTSTDNPLTIKVTIPGGTRGSAQDNTYESNSNRYTTTYYAFFNPITYVDVTFAAAPTNCSYKITVSGSTQTVSTSNVIKTHISQATLSEPSAGSGYVFAGWYQIDGSGKVSDLSSANTYTTMFAENVTLGARFISTTTAKFKNITTGTEYYGLKAATLAASNGQTIIPVAEECLVDGSDLITGSGIQDSYTIPTGVTLLVPYSSANTIQTTPTVVTTEAALATYRKVILKSGVNINCNGTICVGGQVMAGSGGKPTGYTTGVCGMIDMSAGGHIEINYGGTLYAWGFIKGQDMDQGNNTMGCGSITANSGATIWEAFASGDWRGGNATSDIVDTKFFPFQSYFIQNIEIPVTYKSGSLNKNYFALNASGGPYNTTFTLIGNDNALFKLQDSQSEVEKRYDPTTDLMCYELKGTALLDALKLKITGLPLIGTIDINSESFNLPINSNMHIILSDCNMTLTKPMVAQPGAKIEIKEDAKVTISTSIYLYDKDDWGPWVNGKYFRNYGNTYGTLTSHKNRGNGDSNELLDDAQFIVDGELNISSSGKLYTTAGGADIMGNGGGKAVFPSSLPSSTTIPWYRATTTSGDGEKGTSAVASANLCNEDESYTKAIASTTFYNVLGRWFVDGKEGEKTDHTYDFTYISSGAVNGTGGTSTTTDAVYSWDKTGVELQQKWANVTHVVDLTCPWWQGQGEQATWFYNWTLNSAWHQFIPTTTDGLYSSSTNQLYTKSDCTWEPFGSTDINCLYEIGGVKKALVEGQFIALEANHNDPAYHAANDATQYYICFEGCNWHAATKVDGKQKAYTVDGDDYIWYNGAWMKAELEDPFYFTYDATNVKIYYEYIGSDWVIALPYVEVIDAFETRSLLTFNEAVAVASSKTDATIRILRDIPNVITSGVFKGAGRTCTLDLNGHVVNGTCQNLLNINGSGSTFIITDNTTEKKGELRACPEGGNARTIGFTVTAGTLKLEAGKMYSTNTTTRTGSTDATFTKATNTGVVVKAGAVFTVTGGMVESEDEHQPYAVTVETSGTMNLSGTGRVRVYASKWYSTRGVSVANGTFNMSGGTVESSAAGSEVAYGVYVNASASYNADKNTTSKSHGTLNLSGGSIIAESPKNACGVYVVRAFAVQSATNRTIKAEDLGVVKMTGGTITANATTSTSAKGIYSYGTVTVSNGTITANVLKSDQSTAYGVLVYHGNTTISGTTNITANAPTKAYGVWATADVNTTYGILHQSNVTIENGTVTANATKSTIAYAVYVNGNTKNLASGNFTGDYGYAGTVTINNGTFNSNVMTNTAAGVYVVGTKTLNDATASPKCTINNGKFKMTGTATLNGVVGEAATTSANFQIKGGYYSHDGNLATYTPSPKHVTTLPSGDANRPPYYYKVAEAYLVTFKTEDGSANIIDPVYQEVGTRPICSTEPTKASTTTNSFTFDGWATEANGTKVYEPNGLPNVTSAGATYYAHFATTTLKYRVHFDAATNGGECATENIYVNPGTAVGSLPTATKYGYTFNGWFTAATEGAKLEATTVINADADYYAQFTANSHTLTWDLAGGKVSTAGKIGSTTWPAKNATGTPSTSVAYGTVLTTIPVVTRTGYVSNGWSPVPTNSMPDADVTYTALWNPATNTAYTVKHYQQNVDGTYPSTPTETQSLTGTTATSVTPAVKSYDGFISPATQTVTIAAAGTTVVEYQYARRHYTFTLDAYTNDGTSEVPSIEVLHGATIGAVPPDAQKGCNDFTGWYTKPVGGVKITPEFVIEYDMKTLYAQFSDDVRTYPITYLAGAHGTGTVAEGTKTCGEDAILSSSTFTRAGYAQTGWSLTDGGEQAYALGGTYTANASLTLYPVWTINKYTITWKNGSTIIETDENVNYGTTPSFDGTNPTKPIDASYSYTFDGWSTTDGGAKVDPLPAVSCNTIYYAHYSTTPTVASVTVGGATTYYADFAEAWEATNSATGTVTLKLLQDVSGVTTSLAYTNAQNCTLDLNNYTILGSVSDRLLEINAAGKTFTIDDSSAEKGGRLENSKAGKARYYAVYLSAGILNLEHGTIHSSNPSDATYSTLTTNAKKCIATGVYVAASQTFNMNGGEVSASAIYLPIGIQGAGYVNVKGGVVTATATKFTTAYGIYAGSTTKIYDGATITAISTNSTTTYGIYIAAGTTTLYGGKIESYATSANGTTAIGVYAYKGNLSVPESSTVDVIAKSYGKTCYGVQVAASRTATIKAGSYAATSTKASTASGVYSLGTTTISGGTFTISTKTTNAYGVYATRGKITVNGSPIFNVTAGSTTAYGAFAYGTVGANGKSKYSGTIEINGGTFNVTTTTTTAYGAYAGLYSRTVNLVIPENAADTIAGQHYMPGVLVVNDGTFNVKAKTTAAYGIVVAAAKSESGTVGTTARRPTATITGGNFKVESEGDDNATAYAMNTSASATYLKVQGGKYSTKKTSASTNIEDKYTAPTKSCNYHVLDLPSSELPYKYEVAEAYNITFKDGDNNTIQEGPVKKDVTPAYTGATPTKTADSYTYTFNGNWLPAITAVTADATYVAQFDAVSTETGFWLDIIDVDNTNHKLVVNANNSVDWPAASWPFSINDVKYYANTTAGSPARDEKNRLEINYGNLEPGAEFPITITKDATVTSKHTYIIPQEVKTPVTLSDNAPRSIFVKGTTLTIDGDVETKNIYVGDDAKLVINEGKTLTADTIFLRTTPEGAAELINQGTISASTQLCYTRIIMVKGQYYQFGLPLPCAISSVKLSDNATLKYQTGWLLRAYSESKRAAQGAEGKNWETLKAAATIEGGKGYEMYSGSNYYREFYFPVNHADLANNKELTVTRTKDGAAGEKHAGWNVLVSPLTYTCNNVAQPEDMAICLMTSSGWEDQTVLEHIAPAQPFAYQAEEAGTISFVSATMPSLAPRRCIAAADESTRIQWIRLDVKDAKGEGDETNIYSHPTRYEQYYQTGIDVAKQSLTAARARLYSSHAYGDMAFAGVSDELFEQGVALTLYSPAAQELTFSLRQNEWLNRLQYVWIIDAETGAMIDLLSSDYTAEVTEGTTYGRFYISGRFRTPQIATDIESTSDSSLKGRAQKVLIEEKIYIMVGDKLYDATGKLVKGK